LKALVWSFRQRVVAFTATALVLAASLTAMNATGLTSAPAANAAAGVTCSSTMTEQNNLKVTPSHGSVMYIDSGVSPKVDSAYVAYKIDNSSSSARTNVWVQLNNFTGGKVNLANLADASQEITVPAGGTATAFFLLKATGATTSKQAHVVQIFTKRPDLNGASSLLACDFAFTKVQESIKASANKITSVSGVLSPTTATLGGTYTVTVNGDTGKFGAGSSPDGSIIWVSPTAYSSWPTRSLRLISTSLEVCPAANAQNGHVVLTNQLLYKPASIPNCLNGNGDSWIGTYTFQIIGPGPSSLVPSPVADISSGTQYKHSDVAAITTNTTVNLSSVTSSAVSVRVSASGSVVNSTSSSVTIRYTASMTTTSTTGLKVDELVDTHDSGTSLVTGSVKVGTSLASLSAGSDPSVVASDASKTPPPYHFVGPYSISSTSPYYIQYDFTIPCSAVTTTYGTKVVAYTGDVMIGSDSTSISTSSVTTSSSVGCATPTVNNTSVSMTPSATTSPADSITSSTANVNGYAYPVGQTGVQYRFAYGTDPNLVGATTTSLTAVSGTSAVPISAALTLPNTATTYYFRAMVLNNGTYYYGSILSFQTLAQAATPTITTGGATGYQVVANKGQITLSGSLNPNLNQIDGVSFKICQDAALTTSCLTPVTVVMDNGSGVETAFTLASTSSGTYSVNTDGIDASQRVTNLSANTTYYYQVSLTCTYSTTNAPYCPAGGSISGLVRSFKTGAPLALTSDASAVGETTATLNGSVNAAGNNNTATSLCWSTSSSVTNSALDSSPTCNTSTPSTASGSSDTAISLAVTGLVSGTTYYFQAKASVTGFTAYGSVFSFTTLKQTSTSPLSSGAVNSSYSASFTGMGGSGSYTWGTSSTLPAGLTLSNTGLLSGTPTSAGNYSIDVVMTDPSSGLTVTKTFTLSITTAIAVTTSAASAVSASSATLNGSVNNNGNTGSSTTSFCYGTSSVTAANALVTCSAVTATPGSASGSSATSISSALTGLTAGQTYYFQAVGVNNGVTTYGSVLSFTTLNITTASLPNGVVGTAYSSSLAGVGGTGPYTWAVASGLPAGVSLSSGGAFSGNPSSAGSFTFTVTMTDANNQTTTKSFTIVVTASHSAATNPVTSVTYQTATLNGAATSGSAGLTSSNVSSFQLCYSVTKDANGILSGTPTCSGNLWGTTTLTAGQTANFSASAGNLTSGASYWVQAVLTPSTGSVIRGSAVQFTVLDVPVATTNGHSGVTSRGATITGAVNPKKNHLQKVSFCWGTDPSLSSCADDALGSQTWWTDAVTNADQTVSADLTNLTPHTQYYYRVYTVADTATVTTMRVVKRSAPTTGATALGGIQTFTTAWADTTAATSVTRTSATLNGTFHAGTTAIAAGDVTSVLLCYSTQNTLDANGRLSVSPTCSANLWVAGSNSVSASGSVDYTASFTSLTVGTPYYSQIQVTFAGGSTATANGGALLFTTPATVTFHARYPYGTAPTNDGLTQTAAGSTPLRTDSGWSVSGYTFQGWSTGSASNTVSYAAGATYSFAADTNLYAVWSAIPYHVTYALNSGSWVTVRSVADQNVNNTFALAASADVRRAGYTFTGWSDGSATFAGGATYTMPANDVTLTAQWSANTYTVTFDPNTASGAPSKTTDTFVTGQTAGIALATLNTMVKTGGYTLGGWSLTANNGAGGSPVADPFFPDLAGSTSITLYAVWDAPGSKTLTLNSNYPGTAVTQDIRTQSENIQTNLVANPFTLAGYTFTAWNTAASGTGGTAYADTALYNFPNIGNTDPALAVPAVIYAQWTLTSYTVSYVSNGSAASPAGATTSATYQQSFNLPAVGSISRSGYTLTGWNDGTSAYNPGAAYSMPNSNTTLTAVWTAVDYTVTYFGNGSDGGSAPVDSTAYHIGGTATVATAGSLTRTGYSFAGWNTDSAAGISGVAYQPTNTITLSAASVSLYAQWTVLSFDVRYSTGTGSWVTGQTIANAAHGYGSAVNVIDGTTKVTKPGYTFAGWTYNGNTYTTGTNPTSFTMPAAAVDLVASYSAIQYTVSYSIGAGTWTITAPSEPNHVTADTFQVPVASAVTRDGYTFGGWQDASGTYTDSSRTYTVGTSNVVLTAIWNAKTYAITYDPNTATGVASRTSDSYVAGQANALTLPSQNTMSLVSGGAAYVFGGWSLTPGTNGAGGTVLPSSYRPDLAGSQTITLYAVWTAPGSVTVTFHTNYPTGANSTASQSANAPSNLTLVSTTGFAATGYHFVKWNGMADGTSTTNYNDGVQFAFANPTDLYAVWAANTYVVTWDGTTNGGSVAPTSSSYTVGGSALTAPTPAARLGFTFLGWYSSCTGGSLVVSAGASYSPNQSLTLCGVWTTLATSSVLFHGNFGSDPTTTQVSNVAAALTANPFTRSGYSFTGWNTVAGGTGTSYANGANFDFQTNLVLYAQWAVNSEPAPEPVIPTLVISFNYNGGTGPIGSLTLKLGGNVTSLPTGTRDHYTFSGWSETQGGTTLVPVPFVPVSSQTLYAVWVGVTYTITLNPNTPTQPIQVINYQYGTDPVQLPTLTAGYGSFLGWSSSAATGNPISELANVGQNTVLYALWTVPSLVGKVFFDGDKSTLRADAKKALQKVANQILGSPLSGKLLALGWVKKTATTSYDKKLSAARSKAVVKFLQSLGVSADYLAVPKGVAVQKNDTARRVDIYVTWLNPQPATA